MKVFREEQRFTQLWFLTIMGISILVPIGILINEYNKQDSDLSLSSMLLIILFLLICIVPIFFFKLKTRIDEIGIHYQFFPFQLKFRTIKWLEISNAYVRTYDPIGEFGGWGLKGGWSSKKGKAINVSGDIGMQLELTNGKKLLIGTNKKEDANLILKTYKNKLKTNA